MLDVAAFVATVILIALLLRLVIERLVRNRVAAGTLSFLLAFLLAASIALQISRSRGFQFFGGLIGAQPVAEKVVALTLDDGPSSHTADVLRILDEHAVKATFFLIGADIERQPDATRQIAAAGHEIGNHSYSHHRMVFKSERWIAREIETTDRLIQRSGYDGPIHFRSPYGKRLLSLPRYLAAHQRYNVLFDVEPETYGAIARDRDAMVQHVLERTRPGSIILLHPMYGRRNVARAALPAIISGLKARGYRFVTVSELLSLGK